MIEVVAAILTNDKGNFLIAKRKKGKILGGFWEFPGGKIEEGESPEESLIRELKEEMDIDIDVGKYFDSSVFDYGDKVIKLDAYFGKINHGKIVLNDHEEYHWVSREELRNFDFTPSDIPFVEKLTNYIVW